MARYMPFVIGALVAVCTACLFGCFSAGGVPGRSVHTSAGWFRSRSQEIPWYGVT